MTTRRKLARIAGVATAALFLSVANAFAGNPDAQVDERILKLYESADYEAALAVIGSSAEPGARLYRALCLLALGRTPEAEQTVRDLVSTTPDFTPSEKVAPPRFLSLLSQARRELLPVVLRRVFVEARSQFQDKNYDGAIPRLEQLLAIAKQPDVRDVEALADLRLLAEGFLDLAKASRPPAVAAAVRAVDAAPVAAPPTATPPSIINRELPPWPRDVAPLNAPATGTVRLQVSRTGDVIGATMVNGIHPRYDPLVLVNARSWQYAPATLNGVPVDSHATVEIRVMPNR